MVNSTCCTTIRDSRDGCAEARDGVVLLKDSTPKLEHCDSVGSEPVRPVLQIALRRNTLAFAASPSVPWGAGCAIEQS